MAHDQHADRILLFTLALLVVAACGSTPPPVASIPVEVVAPVAYTPPVTSASAEAALPEDIHVKTLVASSTPVCTTSGRFAASTYVLKSGPGGRTLATLRGTGQVNARVFVLSDGNLFAELSLMGVSVRGYLDENPLHLARPRTFGGVWVELIR